jgi:type II secretory pathway pseudopilin PulG
MRFTATTSPRKGLELNAISKYLRLAAAIAVIFIAGTSNALQGQNPPAQGTRKAAPHKPAATNGGSVGVQVPGSDMSWLQDLLKNKELMADLNKFAEHLKDTVQYPAARNQSKVLPRLPESTLFYVAFPNYGETAQQLLQAFQQELKESTAMRDFLQKNKLEATELTIENGIQEFYSLSQYLGDEIVITGKMEGKEPAFLMIAEVKKPGIKELLEKLNIEMFPSKGDRMRVLEPQELASGDASGKMPIALVRPDLLIIGFNLPSVRELNAQIDRDGLKLSSSPMGQRIAQAYQGGTNSIFGVDLHKVIGLIPQTKPQDREMLDKTGFADAKYLVTENRMNAGRSANQMELAFNGPRHGVASWLAAPAPMGGLDFVSSNAAMAVDMILKNPAQIFDDIVDMAPPGAFGNLSQMEAGLNVNLKQDVLSKLTGEVDFEMQMPVMPPGQSSGMTVVNPGAFKVILHVLDPTGLQQTLARLLTMAPMQSGKREEDGVTFYTLTSPTTAGKTTEINYFFLDNYLVIASDAAAATEALRQHRKGESLANSAKFREALAPGQLANASLIMYQNAGQTFGPMLAQMPPELRELMPKGQIDTKPNVYYIYGEPTAFRGTTSNNVNADVSMVLIGAAIAVPNLLRSRIAANESAAAATVRTVNTAEITYNLTYSAKGYAASLAALGPPPGGNCSGNKPTATHACLVDKVLGDASCAAEKWCIKGGYRYSVKGTCTQTTCSGYVVTATPVTVGTGTKNFCSVSDAVIRMKAGAPLETPLTVAGCKAWRPIM